ncbi:MAG: radical SAM protein [Candidatus Woesearchaeota archaeon]
MKKEKVVKDFEPELENYSFCLFRLPEEGGRVIWEITNSCNYSCGYCIFSAEKGRIPDELTNEEVFEVLEGLKEREFSHLKLTGGEPFIRKDFMDILKQSSNLGFIVDVSTNASLITAEKARTIKDLGVQMVHVSIDGHNQELHELARGKNTYQRTIRGLQHLIDNDVNVRVGTVIFKANEDYLSKMVDSAAALGANEIIFSFMEPVGRMKDDYSMISSRPILEVKSKIEQLAEQYVGQIQVKHSFTEDAKHNEQGTCPAVRKFLYIDNLGTVSPCTWVVEQNPKYRSNLTVKEASFDEVMNSKPIRSYLSYIERLNNEEIKGCPVRRRC